MSRQSIALLHPRTTFCEQTVESITGRLAEEEQTGRTSIEKAKAQRRYNVEKAQKDRERKKEEAVVAVQ